MNSLCWPYEIRKESTRRWSQCWMLFLNKFVKSCLCSCWKSPCDALNVCSRIHVLGNPSVTVVGLRSEGGNDGLHSLSTWLHLERPGRCNSQLRTLLKRLNRGGKTHPEGGWSQPVDGGWCVCLSARPSELADCGCKAISCAASLPFYAFLPWQTVSQTKPFFLPSVLFQVFCHHKGKSSQCRRCFCHEKYTPGWIHRGTSMYDFAMYVFIM